MKKTSSMTLIVLSITSAPACMAASFQLLEQSVRSAGTSHAGTAAQADTPSTLFSNPAGMTRLSGQHASASINLVEPEFKFKGQGSFNFDNPLIQRAGLAGKPHAPGSGGDDGGTLALVPNLYYTQQINEQFFWGIGTFVPFGLTTEYDDEWVGRYHTLKSSLKNIYINPNIAWKTNEQWAFALGLNVVYSEAELSNALDFGTIYNLARAANPALPATPDMRPSDLASDGRSTVKGDDWGYGFNLGVLWSPQEGTRLGWHYRSKVNLTLEGEAQFEVPQAARPLTQATGLYQNTGVKAKVALPDSSVFSVYHELTPRWAVMADVAWTNWSVLPELVIQFDNPRQANAITKLNYKDAWRYAVGASYRAHPEWTLRFGVAYDQTPTPSDEYRTPRIPDNDRTWLSLGATYQPNQNLTVEMAYSHLFVGETKIDIEDAYTPELPIGLHRLDGSYDAFVNIFALQAHWRF